jgi:hypothetical protein
MTGRLHFPLLLKQSFLAYKDKVWKGGGIVHSIMIPIYVAMQ